MRPCRRGSTQLAYLVRSGLHMFPQRKKMSLSRRVRLSPFDYHFLVTQRGHGRRDGCPFSCYYVLELDGHPSGSRLRDALRRAMRAYPATCGGIRYSLSRTRAFWEHDSGADLADQAYRHHDLRDRDDWSALADAVLQRSINTEWDLARPPLVRLDHFDGPGGQARVCLLWPHALMDAEGAHWFLRELSRLDADPSPDPPPGLVNHGASLDPLAGLSLLERWRFFREGLDDQSQLSKLHTRHLTVAAPDNGAAHRFVFRLGSTDEFQRVQANARHLMPNGRGFSATAAALNPVVRYLAACVLRAVHRQYQRHGVDAAEYRIAYPMRVSTVATPRPLTGNYISVPTLSASAVAMDDMRAHVEHVHRQITNFRRHRNDVKQWALLWMAGQMQPALYRRVMRSSIGNTPIHSGFSYYDVGADPKWTVLAGATIRRVWLGGVVSNPPGWNAVFCRYRNRLTINLSWVDGSEREALANEFADLIADEVTHDWIPPVIERSRPAAVGAHVTAGEPATIRE